jgi:hypothetical protein
VDIRLGILESTFSNVNRHYEMGLTWLQNDTKLLNNLALAHARLKHLKKILVTTCYMRCIPNQWQAILIKDSLCIDVYILIFDK